VHRGRIQTSPSAVNTPQAKAKLFHETGAIAVDMETTAIAAECGRAGIPLLVLRVITDAASDDIPVSLEIAWNPDSQRPRLLRLAAHLILNPSRIRPFVRFLRHTTLAAEKLAGALERVIAKRPGVTASPVESPHPDLPLQGP
jgi:adenosylhomocysteine nucleosidase